MEQINLFLPEATAIVERVHKRATNYRVPVYSVKMVKETPLKVRGNKPKTVTNPATAAAIVTEALGCLDREAFGLLMLTTKNSILGFHVVSIGTLNSSIVHPREIFKAAFLAGAASIILVHNHPSGDPSPSQEDLEVTRRLVDAGNILGIAVRDHIIIGDDCFFSFKNDGLL